MTRAPKHAAMDVEAAAGIEPTTPPLTRAKLLMQLFNQLERDAIEALEASANPLMLVDPKQLVASDIKPNRRIAVEPVEAMRLCPCAMCTQARTERLERAKEAAFKADKFGAGGGAGGDPGTLRAYPQQLYPLQYRCKCTRDMICNGCATAAAADPPAAARPPRPSPQPVRLNKCDCPGCVPTAEMQRIAGLDPRAQHPVLRAIRFAGLNTPDPKRLGSAQYVRA